MIWDVDSYVVYTSGDVDRPVNGEWFQRPLGPTPAELDRLLTKYERRRTYDRAYRERRNEHRPQS